MGESVVCVGICKFVIINLYGGNVLIIDIVVRDLWVKLDMFVMVINWFCFG